MKPLSALDALFLHLETPQTPMHVGALHLLELPATYRGGFFGDFRQHVASRLAVLPLFTRRLAPMPLGLANPVWVDTDDINLDYHLRRIRLPRPGTRRQLEGLIARLHAQRLDRDRPLWRLHLIEGLESGQLALYTKIHHATLDGAAGVAFANALLDPTSVPRQLESGSRARRSEHPGLAALLGVALKTTASQTARLVGRVPELTRVLRDLIRGEEGSPASGAGLQMLRQNFAFGPHTPLNVAIDSQRSFAAVSLPLGAAKQVAAANGVKLNDVVLAVVAGALRRYLRNRGGIPEKPLIAAMPVSLREAGNTDFTTLATMTLVSLATDIADPGQRLLRIRDNAGAAKALTNRLRAVIPTDFPSLGLPWLLSTAAALYGRARLAERIPPLANVVVSNVRGPAMPLYLAGARLATYSPVSIVEHGLGLNVTVQSYAGSLDFGLLAARKAVPDAEKLADALSEAFTELEAGATELAPTKPPARTKARNRRKSRRS